ncbi:MAG: GAF domain-containing sensor histidine kinase [Chloroflexota bacterium]|nr:GAF domain-containing sensor histidine kinase [Chloroflexota bacterium]
MEHQTQPPRELIAILGSNREELCTAWIDLIQRSPGYQAPGQPTIDLYLLAMRGLDAVIEALSTGSYATLETYLARLNHTILSMGSDIAEANHMMFLLKESAMSAVRRDLPPGSAAALAACGRLDACLDHAVTFLARQYASATNDRLRQRQQQTATLLEIVQAAASTLDLDEVLHRVGDAISAVVGLPHYGFRLIDEERHLLIPHYVAEAERSGSFSASSSRMPALPLSGLDALERHLLEKKEPAICVNTETDPRVVRSLTRLYGIKSMLAIPFVVKGRVVAIAFGCTYDEYRDFTQEEIDLACGIANAVGLAIENARLYQRVKEMAIVEERDRLAREMHDNVAQALSTLQLKASQAAAYLAHGRTQEAKGNLDELEDMISEAHTDVREAIFDMRTIVSPADGLLPTLQDYLDAYRTHYGVDVQMSVQDGLELGLARDAEFQVLRIIQEALTNVRKHADAGRATIDIRLEDSHVRISVSDEGRGFDPVHVMGQAGRHMGLQVMRERADSIGGTLKIESHPGQGSHIILSVPSSPNGGTP